MSNRRLGSVCAAVVLLGATLGGDGLTILGVIGTLGGWAGCTLGGVACGWIGMFGEVVAD